MEQSREDKKVAIVGFAGSWKQAPWDDPSVEIWALNEFWKYAPRWNRWFELHDSDTLGVTSRNPGDAEQARHLEWLAQTHGKPIYMQPQFVGRFPDAVDYPKDEMIATFGRYFVSTIAYMLALAIHEDYPWIGLYGVDLASDVEYPGQRPNTEYFVGLARGQGRTVEIAEGSALLKAGHLYGYEKPLEEQNAKVIEIIQKRKATFQQEHEKRLAELNTLDGAMQVCEDVLQIVKYTNRGVAL
jgi:hypothetical protein